MGGSLEDKINQAANLIVLCGTGTTGCHGWIESHRQEGRETGMLLYRIDDPEQIPFTDIDGVVHWIRNDGTKSP